MYVWKLSGIKMIETKEDGFVDGNVKEELRMMLIWWNLLNPPQVLASPSSL